MRKGIVFLVGLMILAAGIWLIATEHSRQAACKATSGLLSVVSQSCQAIGWDYFGGFVAASLGVIVLLFTALMKHHELRYRGHPEKPTEFSFRLKSTEGAAKR
jgi:hypothetical protein